MAWDSSFAAAESDRAEGYPAVAEPPAAAAAKEWNLIDFREFERHTSGRMRTTSRFAALSVFALALALAGAARADKLLFSGTHAIKFSHNGAIKEVAASGTGVATANGKAGPLNTLALTRAGLAV